MAVITISRTMGSGGDEIARMLCAMLGYGFFDQRMVIEAAAAVGIAENEAVDYSEENYILRSFLDRLLGRAPLPALPSVEGTGIASGGHMSEESALALMQKAMRAAHASGNMVIVGRGGQVVLKYFPGMLHVRIDAPLEARIARMESVPQIGNGARERILARDTASAEYLRRYYTVDWSDSRLYHLVINTGKCTLEQAAQTIAHLAEGLPIIPY